MIDRLERLYWLAWREHDLEAALADLPEDFEWIVPGFPGENHASGPRGTLEFFRDWIDQWSELHVDWELEQSSPETVLAIVHMRGEGRASGVPVKLRFAQVWSFRDGRPRSMVVYPEVDEARRAADP
jgi:ketosteroid isomerase-like protein